MIGTLRGHQRCGWAGARRLAHRPSTPRGWLSRRRAGVLRRRRHHRQLRPFWV